MYQTIRYEKQDQIAIVTIDRPIMYNNLRKLKIA